LKIKVDAKINIYTMRILVQAQAWTEL